MNKNRFPKEYWLNKKFGKLVLLDKDLPDYISAGTHAKYIFKCDCKKEIYKVFKDVFLGKTQSCGLCNSKSKKYWLSFNFGKLKLVDSNLPELILPNVTIKYLFLCICGKKKYIEFGSATEGNTRSCGECTYKPKEYWLSQKFGKLALIDKGLPKFIAPKSYKYYVFKCDCGNTKSLVFNKVTSGRTKSCGCLKIKYIASNDGMTLGQLCKKLNAPYITYQQIAKNISLEFAIQTLLQRSNNGIYIKSRKKLNLYRRLAANLRHRIYEAIKNNYKAGSAVRDLGCTIEFLKQYLEDKFYGKMSWINYGIFWELDHIQELWTFDLTDRKQFLKACNYKNLQPLTIPDHKKKTAKNKPRK